MSKILPSAVVSTLRSNTDILVGYIGQNCKLYKRATETTDERGIQETVTFQDPINTQVKINWSPNNRLLRSLGIHTENRSPLPILAFFKFEDDPLVGDWIELDYEYAVGSTKTNKFEVVDRKLLGHDVEATAAWFLAPKRTA